MTLSDRAKNWADLRKAELKINAQRVKLGQHLMREMKRLGRTSIPVSEEVRVLLEVSTKKSITKAALEKTFGKDVTKKFWDAYPDSVSEYLTLNTEKK